MEATLYRQAEAQEVLNRALAQREASSDGFSHAQLRAMAAELGVDTDTLDRAAAQWRADQEVREARRAFVAERRRGFLGHLTPFVAVNASLVATNLLTDPSHFWAVWPLLGWGSGVLAHGLGALRTGGVGFEEAFRQWRAQGAGGDTEEGHQHERRSAAAV